MFYLNMIIVMNSKVNIHFYNQLSFRYIKTLILLKLNINQFVSTFRPTEQSLLRTYNLNNKLYNFYRSKSILYIQNHEALKKILYGIQGILFIIYVLKIYCKDSWISKQFPPLQVISNLKPLLKMPQATYLSKENLRLIVKEKGVFQV